MVARAARDEAIAAIEEFLDGRFSAFAFDDRPVLTNPERDFSQWLLVLVRSDAETSVSRGRGYYDPGHNALLIQN